MTLRNVFVSTVLKAMDDLLFIFVHCLYHPYSALCKKMQNAKLIDTYTVRELPIEIETLTYIRFLRKVWSDAYRGYKAPEIESN